MSASPRTIFSKFTARELVDAATLRPNLTELEIELLGRLEKALDKINALEDELDDVAPANKVGRP